MDDEHLFDMVETYIGNSKLVILSRAGEFDNYIVNERQGHWSKDRNFWYSNSSYASSQKMVWSNSSQLSLGCDIAKQDDYDTAILPACYICGEESVFDGLCYNCESCQECYQEDEHCLCKAQFNVHALTDAEFHNGGWYR
jgi:hypothetical protein